MRYEVHSSGLGYYIFDTKENRKYGPDDHTYNIYFNKESVEEQCKTLNNKEYSQEFIKHVFDK